ncbi:hypothetical protein G7Y79_00040g077070 [Physcia stellaris]|nr:hypothetical protein G7Y79_00040g077070 [Physcia stellaris]
MSDVSPSGLEADQRVMAAHKCYAMTATTALTAQNTLGVNGIHHTPPVFVKQQIDACIEDIGVDVVKTGMLASAETIDVVADALERHGKPVTVIDPVMVATSGSQLLPETAVNTLRLHLLPLATILTPNIPEAQLLLHEEDDPNHLAIQIKGLEDLIDLTRKVQALGPDYVLIKGGHQPLNKHFDIAKSKAEREYVANILCDKDQKVTMYYMRYQSSRNTHGTGCSLASAIASNLALGYSMVDAVERACRYVEVALLPLHHIRPLLRTQPTTLQLGLHVPTSLILHPLSSQPLHPLLTHPSQASIEEPIPNYPSPEHSNLQERDQKSQRQAQPHPTCPLYPQHRTDNQDFLPPSSLARSRSLHAMHSGLNALYPHLGDANPKTKSQLSFLPQWTDDYGMSGGGARYGETLQGSWPDFLEPEALAPKLEREEMEMEMEAHLIPRSRLDFSLPAGRDGKEEEGYGYGEGWEDIPLDEKGWRMGCCGLALGVLVGFGVGVGAGLVMGGILGLE